MSHSETGVCFCGPSFDKIQVSATARAAFGITSSRLRPPFIRFPYSRLPLGPCGEPVKRNAAQPLPKLRCAEPDGPHSGLVALEGGPSAPEAQVPRTGWAAFRRSIPFAAQSLWKPEFQASDGPRLSAEYRLRPKRT